MHFLAAEQTSITIPGPLESIRTHPSVRVRPSIRDGSAAEAEAEVSLPHRDHFDRALTLL